MSVHDQPQFPAPLFALLLAALASCGLPDQQMTPVLASTAGVAQICGENNYQYGQCPSGGLCSFFDFQDDGETPMYACYNRNLISVQQPPDSVSPPINSGTAGATFDVALFLAEVEIHDGPGTSSADPTSLSFNIGVDNRTPLSSRKVTLERKDTFFRAGSLNERVLTIRAFEETATFSVEVIVGYGDGQSATLGTCSARFDGNLIREGGGGMQEPLACPGALAKIVTSLVMRVDPSAGAGQQWT